MAKNRTIAQLKTEIAAKSKQLANLQAVRSGIAKRLAAVDGEIAALAGGSAAPKRRAKRKAAPKAAPKKAAPKKAVAAKAAPKKAGAKKRGRPRRGHSLADVLARVLTGKGKVRVAEAAKLAVAAGYKSKSDQFGNIVSQTLASDKRFKKIARGLYAKKG